MKNKETLGGGENDLGDTSNTREIEKYDCKKTVRNVDSWSLCSVLLLILLFTLTLYTVLNRTPFALIVNTLA